MEAISAVSTGAAGGMQGAGPARDASVRVVEAEGGKSSEAAEMFRETLGKVHDDVSKFTSDTTSGVKPDPVDAAKAEMLPSPWKNAAPGQAGVAPQGAEVQQVKSAHAEGNAVLRKSFDHAIFVTLVSQVIGGVSQTTSTLIRQQ